MTEQDYAAVCWWSETKQADDVSLRLIDFDRNVIVRITVGPGKILTHGEPISFDVMPSLVQDVIKPVLGKTREEKRAVRSEMLNAIENEDVPVYSDVVSCISEQAAVVMNQIADSLRECRQSVGYENSVILPIGRLADCFPVEMAFRRVYNRFDVWFDSKEFVRGDDCATMSERGRRLAENGSFRITPAGCPCDISLVILTRNGGTVIKPLSKKGQAAAELQSAGPQVRFFAAPDSGITVRIGKNDRRFPLASDVIRAGGGIVDAQVEIGDAGVCIRITDYGNPSASFAIPLDPILREEAHI